jgi:hypothetical protein
MYFNCSNKRRRKMSRELKYTYTYTYIFEDIVPENLTNLAKYINNTINKFRVLYT